MPVRRSRRFACLAPVTNAVRVLTRLALLTACPDLLPVFDRASARPKPRLCATSCCTLAQLLVSQVGSCHPPVSHLVDADQSQRCHFHPSATSQLLHHPSQAQIPEMGVTQGSCNGGFCTTSKMTEMYSERQSALEAYFRKDPRARLRVCSHRLVVATALKMFVVNGCWFSGFTFSTCHCTPETYFSSMVSKCAQQLHQESHSSGRPTQ
ncbi:uncharacterized protein ACBT44_018832 [Syngnathus typhle]